MPSSIMIEEEKQLAVDKLRRVCNPAHFSFATTDEIEAAYHVIGQDRAVEALQFGLDMPGPGFNIFVMGPTGSGRRSILQRIVSQRAAAEETPADWIYVNHFSDPMTPRAISLPPGVGGQFRADMERFNVVLVDRLGQAFETEQYAEAREKFEQQLRAMQQKEFSVVEQACQERGFALVRSPSGLYIAPVAEGELMTPEAFSQLPVNERTQLDQDMNELQNLLNAAMRRLREFERQIQASIEQLDRKVADFTVAPLLDELKDKYSQHEDLQVYLGEVLQDVVESVTIFRDGDDSPDGPGSLLEIPLAQRYRVNLLVDNSHTKGAPVIVEETPTYEKIFGFTEYDVRYGTTVTDFTFIRPGALHKANGGYLILDAEALLAVPDVWAELKRALFNGKIRIESPERQQFVRTVTPLPEPIPLHVKIVLHSLPYAYYALYDYDEDFAKLFKVRADFSPEIVRTDETELAYAHFVGLLCRDEGLLPFSASAVSRVIEFGSRLAEHQNRLSTQLGLIADLIREAAYWASQRQSAAVDKAVVDFEDVQQALRQRERRASLSEELTRQAILENQLLIQTNTRKIGQVNGLTVVNLAEYSYGMPVRVTARVYVGRGNVLDIHREIELGGALHHKGVLTLTGYFGGQYGAHHSLSLAASLSFEQMYDELDGDSASAAELFALISALAEAPLRQDLAVTGAVDQWGRILPIGAVNEKIEGFFEICQARGLTGTQGVLIPEANMCNLMLREDVVAAVREERFHIYTIATVDEGLGLLTGQIVGERDAEGGYPAESLHAAVEARLHAFAGHAKETASANPP